MDNAVKSNLFHLYLMVGRLGMGYQQFMM